MKNNDTPLDLALQNFNSFSLVDSPVGSNAHAGGGDAPRKSDDQLKEEVTSLIQGAIEAFDWAFKTIPTLHYHRHIREDLAGALTEDLDLDTLFDMAHATKECLEELSEDVSETCFSVK